MTVEGFRMTVLSNPVLRRVKNLAFYDHSLNRQ